MTAEVNDLSVEEEILRMEREASIRKTAEAKLRTHFSLLDS